MPKDFGTDLILQDERVLLRPLLQEDEDHLLPFVLKEPELWRYSLDRMQGLDDVRAYISRAVENRMEKRGYPFIIWDKQTEQYAGTTRFYDVQNEQQSTLLGYTWYGRDFQGTGLNRHCKYLLLQYAFEIAGFVRVEFRADAENLRSIQAMKSIGCVYEGTLRSHLRRPDGSRRDSVVYSILKEDWLSGTREMLQAKL